ncbi:MAG: ADP-heptose synthase [Candidatus Pelagibacter sp. TMED273]|nr:MAG: ADP-heptose synthase [Candidatus Pelagibacter sp. TMED273]|tara:strand:- start:2019 stop:3557 length:1539 start_codon:yes stop_codon:yes gene_type:complete
MNKIYKKIVNPKQLIKMIGKFPRQQKVLMCHGVFDLVHPGHIRHLEYCKKHCDYLVVSITTDSHVLKSDLRPYVPEKLRALNLAAIELIDYVLIDNDSKPLKNLKYIKPDIYGKGYEYVDGKINPKTQEEIEVIKSYGGEFMYTPGDYIQSSSYIIENNKPDLKLVKLKTLMENENINFKKLYDCLEKIKGEEVFVLGDTIVDSYIQTEFIGSNAKTPTFSVKYIKNNEYVGGAGVVSKHLKAAGANVTFCSILGNDKLAEFVKKDLNKNKIKTFFFSEKNRPTTNKKVYIAQNYRLLKVDTLDNTPINDDLVDQISQSLKKFKNGTVVFSDFRHGIFNKSSIDKLIASINKRNIKVGDSQIASRWGNILDFKDFDLITPNEKEARFALGDQDSAIRPLASKLYEKANCKSLILTLGERGILTIRKKRDKHDTRAFFSIDSFADNVLDPVGCGDSLLAYSTLAYKVSKNDVISSIIGIIASSIEAGIDGNLPVKNSDIVKKLKIIENKFQYI